MYLWLFRKNDCPNSLNPSLVTLVTTKEKSRAVGVNNPYLDIMIPKNHQLAPVCIFITGQYMVILSRKYAMSNVHFTDQ